MTTRIPRIVLGNYGDGRQGLKCSKPGVNAMTADDSDPSLFYFNTEWDWVVEIHQAGVGRGSDWVNFNALPFYPMIDAQYYNPTTKTIYAEKPYITMSNSRLKDTATQNQPATHYIYVVYLFGVRSPAPPYQINSVDGELQHRDMFWIERGRTPTGVARSGTRIKRIKLSPEREGMKISKPGFDVDTANDAQTAFNTDWAYFQIFDQRAIYIPNASQPVTVRYPKLNALPIVILESSSARQRARTEYIYDPFGYSGRQCRVTYNDHSLVFTADQNGTYVRYTVIRKRAG